MFGSPSWKVGARLGCFLLLAFFVAFSDVAHAHAAADVDVTADASGGDKDSSNSGYVSSSSALLAAAAAVNKNSSSGYNPNEMPIVTAAKAALDDPLIPTICFSIIVVYTLIIEGLLHLLEHSVQELPHLKRLVKIFYKEVSKEGKEA